MVKRLTIDARAALIAWGCDPDRGPEGLREMMRRNWLVDGPSGIDLDEDERETGLPMEPDVQIDGDRVVVRESHWAVACAMRRSAIAEANEAVVDLRGAIEVVVDFGRAREWLDRRRLLRGDQVYDIAHALMENRREPRWLARHIDCDDARCDSWLIEFGHRSTCFVMAMRAEDAKPWTTTNSPCSTDGRFVAIDFICVDDTSDNWSRSDLEGDGWTVDEIRRHLDRLAASHR